ncbi:MULTISPECIES: ABC transporter permease [Desulfobacula]|uniref:Binding protein-dependent transport system, inner membrane component n=2 Tax=Desulfobacula TaxID=28222 RepID=K0NSX9_DESTT|nr:MULTISPECIES: ABC transporter permease [Desulfobacula]CCK82112.1 binding protein-dependent transport system, inner membrane component [Desulfobacula toluolica Tol2]SDU46565.1 NitT/TauT family transport system permease protein [Desulfobacula phenolica]
MKHINIKKLISPIILLLLWELIARIGWIPNWFLPVPSTVLQVLWEMILSGEVPKHTGISLLRGFTGYGFAAVFGIGLGLLIAWSKIIENIFDPLIELIRPLSTFALIPIFFLWFGIGNTSKIIIIFKACFFPIVINTISGIKGVDSKLIQAARSLGATERQLWTKVFIPSALPMIITGMRISTAISIMALVGVEMLAGDSGIGFLVIDAQRTFDTERVFAGIIVLSILGFSLDRIARMIQYRILSWHTQTSLEGGRT